VNLFNRLASLLDRILDISGILGAMLLIFIMLFVSSAVVFRYFLHSPIVGFDQISEIALLYITFLGAAWLLRREGHVSIDILYAHLSHKAQTWLGFITSTIGVVMFVVLTWYGIETTLDLYQRGVVTPTLLEIPRALIVAIIPMGSFLLSLQFVRRGWLFFKRILSEGEAVNNN